MVHYLAPLVLVGVVFLSYAVLPVGRNMVAVNLDSGVLYFFAVGGATELAVFMAGWSSRNKYSLLGAMRAIAQMISYEIPLILSSVPVIMMAGTLSLVGIVEQQARSSGGLAHWNVFTPWGLAGFILFMIAATRRRIGARSICRRASRRLLPATLSSIRDLNSRCFSWPNIWRCSR